MLLRCSPVIVGQSNPELELPAWRTLLERALGGGDLRDRPVILGVPLATPLQMKDID